MTVDPAINTVPAALSVGTRPSADTKSYLSPSKQDSCGSTTVKRASAKYVWNIIVYNLEKYDLISLLDVPMIR